MRRTFRYVSALVLTLLLALPAIGQKAPAAAGAPVRLNGETLFTLDNGVGSLTPAERAEVVGRRLAQITRTPLYSVNATVQRAEGGWAVMVGGRQVILATDADARTQNTTAESLANRWATLLSAALLENRSTTLRDLLWHLGITLLVIACAIGLIAGLRWGWKWSEAKLGTQREKLPALRLREMEIVSNEKLYRSLRTSLHFIGLFLRLLVVVVAGLLVFDQFPATQGYAESAALWLWEPLRDIFLGVLHYLPNLFYILVIIAVTRLVLRAVTFLFLQAERGVINLAPWVHRDVARPTGTLVKAFIVIVALFFIAPLIPGTGSRAAQAITLILGLMVSFGSSSTVGNVIAGIVLTYMRPFRLGERVKVGEVTGDVVEKTFLYTKVRTIKNEEVIVPSLQAIGGAITNYSALASRQGLILHTSVTIGYDAPWRKVHELLQAAAAKTKDVQKEPAPFVWQTALNDFFVSYQLNVYTHRADRMMGIYAELHQNIQDCFNEAGMEIMSPHYMQLRDGNTTSVPESYRPPEYQPRRFQVENRAPEQAG